MGCCFFAALGAFVPRFALFLMWIFTDWIGQAVGWWLWCVLGFLFVPITTLVYVLFYHYTGDVNGFDWIWVVLALILDVANWGGGNRAQRKRA